RIVHLHADIFEAEAVYSGPVTVLDIHGDVSVPDHVDIAEDHVGNFRSAGLRPNLQRPSPVAPDDQSADAQVAHRLAVVALPGDSPRASRVAFYALDHHGIIEGADEGVTHRHILGIAHVNAI